MQEMQETQIQSLCGKDPLEEKMATHSSILAWRIPRTEEAGGLQSMGSQSRTWPSMSMSIPLCRDHIWFTHPSVDTWALLHFQFSSVQFSSVAQSCPTLQHHGLQHTRLPCPSPIPRACTNSCPSSWWCHPTISSSVIPFSYYLQSIPALGSFPVSQFFTSGGQSIGVSASASVLAMNIQDWFPLGLSDLIFLQSKRLLRVFSNTTVQKHQFFDTQPSLVQFSHLYMAIGKTIALPI